MSHDARAVANCLIKRARDDSSPLTPLQIVKLVYFCHGWMLGLHERPLVRQYVRAWLYGPVVAEVYRSLKKYGGNPVEVDVDVPGEEFDEQEEYLIKQVYLKYGSLTGIELSQLTHAPGTPWYKVWHEEGRNAIIPNLLIQKHYAEKARDAESEGNS